LIIGRERQEAKQKCEGSTLAGKCMEKRRRSVM